MSAASKSRLTATTKRLSERLIRRDHVEEKGEESLITGQYTQMIEAEVHLGEWESSHENTRFLELAMDGGEDHDDLPEFKEISDLVWNGHKCTPRGDIHERIADAKKEGRTLQA